MSSILDSPFRFPLIPHFLRNQWLRKYPILEFEMNCYININFYLSYQIFQFKFIDGDKYLFIKANIA